MSRAAKVIGVQGSRDKVRMTVDLTPEFQDRLENLENRTYLGNKATVIRHALTIYEYLVNVIEDGGEVVVRGPKGEERHLDRISLAVSS
jgi:predicted DNA-binding protein